MSFFHGEMWFVPPTQTEYENKDRHVDYMREKGRRMKRAVVLVCVCVDE